jgi:hypothetical protein
MTHWDRFTFKTWKRNGCPVDTEVEKIDLSYNARGTLGSKTEPVIFKNLPNLKILDISYNKFKEFPIEICDLVNLELLDMSSNCIETIPQCFKNLKNLILFHANMNNIKSVENICDNIKILSLESNNLTNITTQFKSIEMIDFGHNSISDLSFVEHLDTLQHLNVSNNKIHNIPYFIGNLSNLTHLDCSYNELSHIHHSIGNLHGLRNLLLEGNKHLGSIPAEIGQLNNIQLFSIDNIFYIPPNIKRMIENKRDMLNNVQKDSPKIIPISQQSKTCFLRMLSVIPQPKSAGIPTTLLNEKTRNTIIQYCKNDSLFGDLNATFNDIYCAILNHNVHNPIFFINYLNTLGDDCPESFLYKFIHYFACVDTCVFSTINSEKQILSVIDDVKTTLKSNNTYSVNLHKIIVYDTLYSIGYTKDVIQKYLCDPILLD